MEAYTISPKKNKIVLLASLLALFCIITGCSKEGETEDPEAQKFYAETFTPLENGENLFNELTTTLDTVSAMDSVLNYLLSKNEVIWGMTGKQGISLEFSNGTLGAIFIDPMDEPDDDDILPEGMQRRKKSGSGSLFPENVIPASKKAILLNPSYWERKRYADPIIDNYDNNLSKVNFEQVHIYKNEEASLKRFKELDDYGIIHIYSHGYAWPSSDSIERVFLYTGQEYSPDLYSEYLSEIQNENMLLTMYHGKKIIMISPEFIINNNDFRESEALIYGGFCFSGLGQWPELMAGLDGGAGYLGFDWSVLTIWNAFWNKELVNCLTDSSGGTVHSVSDWIDNDLTKYYYSHKADRNVNIYFKGKPDLALIQQEESDLSYTKCRLNCRINVQLDQYSSTSGNDTSYISQANMKILDEFTYNGNFSDNTFTGVYDEQFADGKKYYSFVTITLSSNQDEIMEFEYSYSYQSATAKDSIYVSAKNIPLSQRDETYNELEYYVEGSETCSAINSVLFTKLLDWPEAEIYSTKQLTDFNCNEYSFFNVEFQ